MQGKGTPVDGSRVEQLRQLVGRQPGFDEWVGGLESANARELTRLISVLTTGMHQDRSQTYRESAVTVLHQKLTSDLIDALDRLDASAQKLEKTSIRIAIIFGLTGTLISIVSLLKN